MKFKKKPKKPIFKQFYVKKPCNANCEMAESLLPSSATDDRLNLISYIYMEKNINLTGIYRKLFHQCEKLTGLHVWQK